MSMSILESSTTYLTASARRVDTFNGNTVKWRNQLQKVNVKFRLEEETWSIFRKYLTVPNNHLQVRKRSIFNFKLTCHLFTCGWFSFMYIFQVILKLGNFHLLTWGQTCKLCLSPSRCIQIQTYTNKEESSTFSRTTLGYDQQIKWNSKPRENGLLYKITQRKVIHFVKGINAFHS